MEKIRNESLPPDQSVPQATSALALRAWTLDPVGHRYGSEVTSLINSERRIPISVGIDQSLRVKVVDACGMTCVFCHNEGTPVAADQRRIDLDLPVRQYSGRVSVFTETNGVNFTPGVMKPDSDLKNSLGILKEELDLNELHLTGGEPSLNKDLARIIELAANLGYKVKMTSNGENGAKNIPSYANAGLDKVIFSIFGTTPEELASVQHEKYAEVERAARKINALHRSIAAAVQSKVEVAANVVVPDDTHFERLTRILTEFEPKLRLRLLNDLDGGNISNYAIYKFLSDVGASPVSAQVEVGSSNAKVTYALPDGRSIDYKHLRTTRLPDTCADCSMKSDEDCKEGFYGVRLYIDNEGKYKVGVCIQRMDLTQNIDDFTRSPLPLEIRRLREQEQQQLTGSVVVDKSP